MRGALAVAVLLSSGCVLYTPGVRVGDVPLPPGVPLGAVSGPKAPLPQEPEPRPGEVLELPRALSLALAHSPQTRSAWAQARASAAAVGASQSAYYPSLDLDGQGAIQHQPVGGGRFVFDQTSAGPALNLSWLLLDFGTRSANVDAARQTLIAATFAVDASVQDTLLRAEQAYYGLVTSTALADAERSSVREAEAALAAATDRERAGVATIADVLQAKTALSQAQLSLQGTQAQLEVSKGTLATLVGMKIDAPLAVAPLPADLAVKELTRRAGAQLELAEAHRPDLARARAQAQAQARRADAVRASAYPSLSVSGNAGRSYYFGAAARPFADAYSATLLLRFPLFDGFRTGYGVAQQEALADAAKADADTLGQQVAIDVWSSYQTVQSAALQVRVARDLLASAQQLGEVAMGRYGTGTGTILELMTAQATLASARAQEIQARANWVLALVRLAHSTGRLGFEPPAQELER